MSSPEADAAQDSIQLHFCQNCGISIPLSEVDSGRARPAPGGYVCADCGTAGEVFAGAAVAGAPADAPAAVRKDGGVRVLVAIALLYVVGATTFLLIREAGRKPPVIDLTGVPTTREFAALAKKVENLDEHDRQLLTSVQGTSAVHREDLRKLQSRLADLERFAQEDAKKTATLLAELRKSVLLIGKSAGVLERDVTELLDEIKRLQESGGGNTAVAPTKTTRETEQPKPTRDDPPATGPVKSAEEQERDREVREYIAILDSKKASGQERYDAAVNLGDLQHPDAVEPLTRALDQNSDTLLKRAAAWALGRHGKLAVGAIPTLIKQIGGKEAYVGYTCVDTLKRITKDALGAEASVGEPFDPTMNQKQRRKVQRAWEGWWSKNQKLLGA